jgi:hypothetical protein
MLDEHAWLVVVSGSVRDDDPMERMTDAMCNGMCCTSLIWSDSPWRRQQRSARRTLICCIATHMHTTAAAIACEVSRIVRCCTIGDVDAARRSRGTFLSHHGLQH